MGNTMREMFEKMSPEQQRLQKLQGLIASLVFGRFGGDGCFVSRAAPFTQEYLEKYNKYKQASDAWKAGDEDAFEKAGVQRGFTHAGFGYPQSTEDELASLGFASGQKIGFTIIGSNGYSERDLSKEEVTKYGSRTVEHFSTLGVRCKAVIGGGLPDQMNGVAVIFDVNDPQFLEKIKPDFLGHFPIREGKQLSRSNHDYHGDEQQDYIHEVIRLLGKYTDKNGFELNIELPEYEGSIAENVTSMAKHKMDFFKEGMDVMLPVLTAEEKKVVMIEIMDRVVSNATDLKPFKQIRRMALA